MGKTITPDLIDDAHLGFLSADVSPSLSWKDKCTRLLSEYATIMLKGMCTFIHQVEFLSFVSDVQVMAGSRGRGMRV